MKNRNELIAACTVDGVTDWAKYRETVRTYRAALEDLKERVNNDRNENRTPAETVAAWVAAVGYDVAVVVLSSAIAVVGEWDARISGTVRAWANENGYDRESALDMCLYTDAIHNCHKDQLAAALMEYKPTAPEEAEQTAEPAHDPASAETAETATSKATAEPAPAYIISENPQFGSLEITFSEKPAETVREALKAMKFRWNGKRGLWYGFADAETVRAALDGESAPATAGKVTETKSRKQSNKPDQDRIRIYYNGIKLNGGELIGCSYSLNNHRDFDKCVTIYAKNYGSQLPSDLLPVSNETDIYTDYFDTDNATITPDHPLYKYFRYAAMKADAKFAERYIKYDPDRYQSRIDAFKAETDPGQPTAADLATIDRQRQESENARRAAEHEAELAEREKILNQGAEGRKYIESVAAAHPIKDGEPVVEIPFSESPYFRTWTNSRDKTRTVCTINADGTRTTETIVEEPRRRLFLSVTAAEIILDHFDKLVYLEHRGYDKTDFVITWTEDGETEPSRYEGRYDLGDRDGGMIAHIRSLGRWYCEHDAFGHTKPEPDEENDQTRFADFLETFLHRPETIQTDEIHRYTINGNRVQFFELMGDRWVALGDPETWDASLIDELKRA